MSWAAVIIGGAALVGGVTSSVMAGNAAEDQAKAYGSAEEMQYAYLRSVRKDIADAVDSGLIDLDTGFNQAIRELRPLAGTESLNAYRNLLADPSSVMDRPGVQYQYNQGVDALQSAFSRTSGGGLSGSSLKAAQEYGQNFAAQALDAELARLTPLINIETGAMNNIANLEAGKGQAKSNLRLSGATGSGNLTSSMTGNIAQTQIGAGEARASNSINQANIANNVLDQLGLLGAMKSNSLFKSPT